MANGRLPPHSGSSGLCCCATRLVGVQRPGCLRQRVGERKAHVHDHRAAVVPRPGEHMRRHRRAVGVAARDHLRGQPGGDAGVEPGLDRGHGPLAGRPGVGEQRRRHRGQRALQHRRFVVARARRAGGRRAQVVELARERAQGRRSARHGLEGGHADVAEGPARHRRRVGRRVPDQLQGQPVPGVEHRFRRYRGRGVGGRSRRRADEREAGDQRRARPASAASTHARQARAAPTSFHRPGTTSAARASLSASPIRNGVRPQARVWSQALANLAGSNRPPSTIWCSQATPGR